MIQVRNLYHWAIGVSLAACLAISCEGQEEYVSSKVKENAAMMKELMRDRASRATVFASALASFRESALEKTGDAVNYCFEPSALSQWRDSIALEMIEMQTTDFFTGAIMMTGPSEEDSAIMGLYNPWWDAMLLVKMIVKERDSRESPHIAISDFYFISGETMRDEQPPSNDADINCATVIPRDGPISPEIWRVTAGTRKAFMEHFPIEDDLSSWGAFAGKLLDMDFKEEIKRIQIRSALRMQLTVKLFRNATDAGIVSVMAQLARTGTYYQLHKYFRDRNSRPFIRTMSEMPKMFREDFLPYGYVPMEEGTLFILINRKVPRLYATVSLPKDRKKTPPQFEWYDLLQVDELLAAWNGRKEVAE